MKTTEPGLIASPSITLQQSPKYTIVQVEQLSRSKLQNNKLIP
jgi:hypothetical protein